jgi:recombination protein RecR
LESTPESINRLIEEFSRFPGIGRKTAQRMTFHLLNAQSNQALQLAEAVMNMKTKVQLCSECSGITEKDPCWICANPKRDHTSICIVENAADIYSIEKTNAFHGVYHVLGGVLSPLDGIGPDDLNIKSLVERAKQGYEVIIATNPSIEGEATSLYIAKLLDEKDIKVTRLARGIPVGGDLEYIDEATLLKAMEGRTSL